MASLLGVELEFNMRDSEVIAIPVCISWSYLGINSNASAQLNVFLQHV